MAWRHVTEVDPGGGVAERYYLDLPGFGTGGLGSVETFTKTNPALAFSVGSYVGNMTVTASGTTWGSGTSVPHGLVVEAASASGAPTFTARRVLTQIVQPNVDNISNSVWMSEMKYLGDLLPVTKPGGETWSTGQNIFAYTDSLGAVSFTNVQATATATIYARWKAGIAAGADASGNWSIRLDYDICASPFIGSKNNLGIAVPDGAVPAPSTTTFGASLFSDYGKTTFGTSATGTTTIFRGVVVGLIGTGASLQAIYRIAGQSTLPAAAAAALMAPPQTEYYQSGYDVYQFDVGVNSWTGTAPYENPIFDYLYVHLPVFSVYDTSVSDINGAGSMPDFSVDVSLPGTPFGNARIVWTNGFPSICRRSDYSSAPASGMMLNDVPRPYDAATIGGDPLHRMPGLASHCGVPVKFANLHSGGFQATVPYEAIPTATVTLLFRAPTAFATNLQWGYGDVRSGYPTTPWTVASSSGAPSSTGHLSNPTTDHFTCTIPAPTLVPSTLGQLALSADNSFSVAIISVVINGQIEFPAYPWSTIVPAWLVGDSDVTPVANPGWIDPIRTEMGTVTWTGTPVVAWTGTQITVDISGVSTSKVSDIRGQDTHTAKSYKADIRYKELRYDQNVGRWGEPVTYFMSSGPYTVKKPDPSAGSNEILVTVIVTDTYFNSILQTSYFTKVFELSVTIP